MSPTAAGQLVDIDRPETWPTEVRRVVDRHICDVDDASSGTLRSLDAEPALRAALAGHSVLAFHCTRLFPHEVESIRRRGLRALDEGLVRDRICDAVEAGLLTDGARLHAETANVFVAGNVDGRAGQVCFVLGRGVFDHDAGAVIPLLSIWGGEAIRGGPDVPSVLQRHGIPTIVATRLDLAAGTWGSFPALPTAFAAALDGGWASADLHWHGDVPAHCIAACWQPGHPEYDRHPQLPDADASVDLG